MGASRASRSARSSSGWSTSTRPATTSRSGTSRAYGSSSTSLQGRLRPEDSTANRWTRGSSSRCWPRTR
jgi:hypothetical protein